LTLEISPIVNFHAFKQRESAYTRLFNLWPSGQGGHAIYLPKYKEENVFLLIDLLTLIQWVNIACICFLKGKQSYKRFFDNIDFLIRGGHNIRF
jgi:hypothetical protein